MKILVLIMLGALIFCCVTQKKADHVLHVISEVRFGSSGGFTGLGNQYVIKSNGNVYKEFSDSLKFITQFNNKEIRIIKLNLAEIDFKNIQLLDKGNMTYFIEVKTSDWQNKVTWSDQTQHDNIKHFYQTLVKALKNH